MTASGAAKAASADRRVGGGLLHGHMTDFDIVKLVRQRVRYLHAADRLPVARHQIVGGVARDIVVVDGADRGRQVRLGVEQDGEFDPVVGVVHRRIGRVAELLGAGGAEVLGVIQRLEQQRRRRPLELAQLRRDPHAGRRRAGAVRSGNEAHRGRDHFGIFHGRRRRRIHHRAVDLGTDRALGKVRRDGEGGVAEEARLAIGLERLAGLPMLRRAFHRQALERLDGVGAAFGRDRRLDQVERGFLRGRHPDQRGGGEQCRRNADEMLHESLLCGTLRPGHDDPCHGDADVTRQRRSLRSAIALKTAVAVRGLTRPGHCPDETQRPAHGRQHRALSTRSGQLPR